MAGLFGAKAPQANAYAQRLMQNAVSPETQSAVDQYAAMPAQKKPSFFGEGGIGRSLAGIIGDTLLQQNNFAPVYAPAMQQRQAMDFSMRQAQAKRQAEMEDWQAKQQWAMDHPAPVNNDTVNDFNWFKSLSPEDQQTYARLKQGDPLVNITLPNGQFYSGPQSGLGAVLGANQAPAAPQTKSIDGKTYQNIGGKWYEMGGPTQNASGTFPAFSKAIIGQESGGRYGVANTEGSGAMGVGQIMPDTAKTLAARVGLPYRPDLMAGNHPEAQTYQNALTNAALQEAWRYGGGDPRKAAYYYFAGPNQKGWGPKTRQYGESILRRMGGR